MTSSIIWAGTLDNYSDGSHDDFISNMDLWVILCSLSFQQFCFILVDLFWNEISLCSPMWSQIHKPPALSLQVLVLGKKITNKRLYLVHFCYCFLETSSYYLQVLCWLTFLLSLCQTFLFTICFSAFSTFSFFLTTTFLIAMMCFPTGIDFFISLMLNFYFIHVACSLIWLYLFFSVILLSEYIFLSLFIYLIQISLFLLWISHHILQSHSHSSVLPYLSSTHVTSSQKKITN